MKDFHLQFKISDSVEKINLRDVIFLMGSCFSDEMSKKLHSSKFNILANPFGTLYNSHSIFKILKGELDNDSITQQNDVFYHWDTHGAISSTNRESLIQKVQEKSEQTSTFIDQSDWIIITLGTAHVYELKETGQIVANCHKAPQDWFTKKLLTTDTIIDGFNSFYEQIKDTKRQIIFTVSPVRHIRDGLVENNLSKSILIQAIHEIVNNNQNTHYFPSYEIMIDELRDYRFYKQDRIHPNEEAIGYIWHRFVDTFMDEETRQFIKKWKTIQTAILHRPHHPSSSSHQKFIKETLQKLDDFKDLVDISNEQERLENQLT